MEALAKDDPLQFLHDWSTETQYKNYYRPIQLTYENNMDNISLNKLETAKIFTAEDENAVSVTLLPFHSIRLSQRNMAINCGGPVWAMDWLLLNDAQLESSAKDAVQWQYLAISTHPPCSVKDGIVETDSPPEHSYKAQSCGRGIIQIWAVPSLAVLTPKLIYAIDHDIGAVWDMKWRKHRTSTTYAVLAVCAGNGSLQIFHVPLNALHKIDEYPRIESLQPKMIGKLSNGVQLCLEWSPHSLYRLISGCADGSVALWNLEPVYGDECDVSSDLVQLLPQRVFQDSDSMGKIDAFGWGPGWVAVRALAWSPTDTNIFASTGNDSNLKIWDLREPRLSLRCHRIRSTWGICLRWIEEYSIHYSGDQGAIYKCDIITGSYQCLYFHPQSDSPVWDLQHIKHPVSTLMLSCCASGNVRVAAAKKLKRKKEIVLDLFRITLGNTHSVRDSTETKKAAHDICLDMEPRICQGQENKSSGKKREFSPRELAFHKLKLNKLDGVTSVSDMPLLLAVAGHAGLLILGDVSDRIDSALDSMSLQPRKKGRPPKKQNLLKSSLKKKQRVRRVKAEDSLSVKPVPESTYKTTTIDKLHKDASELAETTITQHKEAKKHIRQDLSVRRSTRRSKISEVGCVKGTGSSDGTADECAASTPQTRTRKRLSYLQSSGRQCKTRTLVQAKLT